MPAHTSGLERSSDGPSGGHASAVCAHWGEHLDWMEGLEPVEPETPKPSARWPGVLLAAGLAAASLWLAKAPFWPFTLSDGTHPFDAVLLAMLLGMLCGNVWSRALAVRSGISFGSKVLLPLGIVLLGARLNFTELMRVGAMGIVLSAAFVIAALALTYYLIAPLFGIPRRFAFLLGVGSGICGGTAIVAIAPVVKAKEDEVILGVASVTLVGLVAMFVLPVIATGANLGQMTYGVWAGLTIHQTPQVIAAGFAYGAEAGETATVIKLARVCLLAPMVVLAGLWMARKQGTGSSFSARLLVKAFPGFVLGFIAMAAARSLGFLPEIQFHWENNPAGIGNIAFSVREIAVDAATFFLALGMAGVGWDTRMSSLGRAGWRPLAVTALVSLLVGAAAYMGSAAFFGPK